MRKLSAGLVKRVMMRASTFVASWRRHRQPVHYGGREFSAPQSLREARLPSEPGLYAIQVRKWWGGLKPIQFGMCQNLHEEMMVEGDVGFVRWLMHPASRRGLYVSFETAPDLDHESRQRVGIALNRRYFPRRTQSVDEHLANHRIYRLAGGSH